MVATIIMSITYSAAIQIPGGYDTNGMANLKGKPSFIRFMRFNSAAFGVSTCSIFLCLLFKVIFRLLCSSSFKSLLVFIQIWLLLIFTFFSTSLIYNSFQEATNSILPDFHGSANMALISFFWYLLVNFPLPVTGVIVLSLTYLSNYFSGSCRKYVLEQAITACRMLLRL